MFLTPLDDIDFHHIEEFCRTWPEGVRVEYKQELTQIPKVISSFANTVGGIWIIGAETEETTHRPKLPLQGIDRGIEVEERITHACWQGIYPPITPMIKPVALPSDPQRFVWVVKVPESIEAPHAIQNSTRVYVRVNNVTEPVELADIDRIDFLLNRRRDPEQRRERMIEAAVRRSGVGEPCIRVMVGPQYPDRPRLTEDTLARQLELPDMKRWRWRRIQQGFISVATSPITERFEVNLYGLLSYAVPFSEKRQSTHLIHPNDIIFPIGSTLHRAEALLQETIMNLFARVSLEGALNYAIATDWYHSQPGDPNPYQAIEQPIVAEKSFPRETLEKDFRTHVTDLFRELMWAFDWVDDRTLASWVASSVKTQWGR